MNETDNVVIQNSNEEVVTDITEKDVNGRFFKFFILILCNLKIYFQKGTKSTNGKENEKNENKEDIPEQVREMIEVFESREEMQQESIAKKMISLDTESVCLSVTEYYGLIISTMLLLALLLTVATIIGLLYKYAFN